MGCDRTVQLREDRRGNGATHYRVHDSDDNRVATCYLEVNAQEVVRLMNLGFNAQADDIG